MADSPKSSTISSQSPSHSTLQKNPLEEGSEEEDSPPASPEADVDPDESTENFDEKRYLYRNKAVNSAEITSTLTLEEEDTSGLDHKWNSPHLQIPSISVLHQDESREIQISEERTENFTSSKLVSEVEQEVQYGPTSPPYEPYDPEHPQLHPDPLSTANATLPAYVDENDIRVLPNSNHPFLPTEIQTPVFNQQIHNTTVPQIQFRFQSKSSLFGEKHLKQNIYQVPFKHPRFQMLKPCRYWKNSGTCQFGDRCRFLHFPLDVQFPNESTQFHSSCLGQKRNNKCLTENCNAFAKVDYCNECCEKYHLCENRPCGALRLGSGEQPTLCQKCLLNERRLKPKLCVSQGCVNTCLSFHTHCRDCYLFSKQKKCANPSCNQSVAALQHRLCGQCHYLRGTLSNRPRFQSSPKKSR
jgi:hypothetical protein